MYSLEVSGATSGTQITIKPGQAAVASFPVPLADLPAGRYRVQAVLDAARANSSWRREPGNLHSDVRTIDIPAEGSLTIDLPLDTRIEAERPPSAPGVEYVEIESRLLSEFRGRPVTLRAGVLRPLGHIPARRYPAIFEVPGFGGDHTGIVSDAHARQTSTGRHAGPLERAVFRIMLDPDGPNGHHLFADSAVNGPVGRALVEELIPELTRRFNLIDAPEARLLRGHSSGGWSVLWLATEYPHVFGAAWASSPDPVDFRRFQLINIYEDASMYRRGSAVGETPDTPSYTDSRGRPRMTIRQENLMEEVLGPGNTSAQQWDSWLAVFGARGDRGAPADIYHPDTGAIDHAAAEAMRPYDIADRLRAAPGRCGPIFRDSIRLIVGDMDNYALDEAVSLLRDDLERLGFLGDGRAHAGYVKIVPGLDHGSIFGSPAMQAIDREMMDHLIEHADITTGL
jgi:hypothetical protein